MQFPSGDEQTRMCVCICVETEWEWQREREEGGMWGTKRKESVRKCGLWSTCICCAIFVRSLANGAGSGQGALGPVLEDGGGELLQGAAQQVGCLLGPLMTCKLFPASWDTCMKTSISPSASYHRHMASLVALWQSCLSQSGIMSPVMLTLTQLGRTCTKNMLKMLNNWKKDVHPLQQLLFHVPLL